MAITKTTVAMAFLIMINLWSCQDKRTDKTAIITSKKLVLVLCDVSSSIDSALTRVNMDNNINDLFFAISSYPGTEYYFYPMGNSLNRYIVHDSILADVVTNNTKISSNIRILDHTFSDIQNDSSCIIDCLAGIADKIALSQKDPDYTSIHMVLLSDMLEACPRGKIFINLEDRRYAQAMEWLKTWNPVSAYYANLPKLKINIIFSTNIPTDRDMLKAFWLLYFKKVGFASDIFFGTEISKSNFLP